jgi:hypothetical protein
MSQEEGRINGSAGCNHTCRATPETAHRPTVGFAMQLV